MRNTLCLAFTLAAGLAVAAAVKQEPVTYLEGNLVGVVPNTGGSLVFAHDAQMELRTGLATVAVPYADIAKAKLGSIREQGSSDPLYKIWTLHKHLMKTQLQKVTVEFKNSDGEQKSMTVELEKSAASHLVQNIHRANNDAETGIKEPQASVTSPNAWWGDDKWKTTRNASQWPAPAPAPQK